MQRKGRWDPFVGVFGEADRSDPLTQRAGRRGMCLSRSSSSAPSNARRLLQTLNKAAPHGAGLALLRVHIVVQIVGGPLFHRGRVDIMSEDQYDPDPEFQIWYPDDPEVHVVSSDRLQLATDDFYPG